ncbi:hypothetical protein OROMI_025350 [Orobanche minor]
MILSKLKPLQHLSNRFYRRVLDVSASAVARQDTTLWTPAPLVKISLAAESLFHITFDVSESPELANSYTKAGQYVHVRLQDPYARPTSLAISSPPSVAASSGIFEFLVKSIPGSTAELLCRLQKGDVVGLSAVMGKGFEIDRISPPDIYQTVLIFATGAGISPIRERFKDWKSSGVNIVPVLSQPDDNWKGEQGFVQAAFARAKRISSPQSTGAVLCGHRQMAEVS